jgi:hypothetical protein
MGKTGNVRSGSRARRSRRELHERYVTVDRSVSRRTSSEAYKYTESSTICRPDPQEELSPGVRDMLMGVPDPEHGCGTLDTEHELKSIPCSVQLDDRLSVSVSEATEDVILRDAVFANNDTVDGEQVDERSAVGTENSDLGDECIEPSHAEALCNITNSGLKITPCMASYRIIADFGDVVSVRQEVLVTIAPHHIFFFFVLSPSSHIISSRRRGISSNTSVVQNEKAWRQFTNTVWDATQDHESCDRTCSYADPKFLSHVLGVGQSQNRKW